MFDELLIQRQSCRNFDASRTVEREKLESVLKAGIVAPSARNFQPWNFYVCAGETADKVRKECQHGGANAFLNNCPVLIAVGIRQKPETAGARPLNVTKQDFRPLDAGIAVGQMCLEATNVGLSTCIIGWMNCPAIAEILNTEDEIKVVIALGYASHDDVLRPKNRRNFNDVVKFFD